MRWLVALLLVAGCRGGEPAPARVATPEVDSFPARLGDQSLSPRIANYRLDARLDAETKRIHGEMELSWRNTAQRAVERLPFHLYMNAFKNEDSVFMRESGGRHRSAKASSNHWGWIEVNSIKVDGGDERRPAATMPGPDETVLELPLQTAVEPGQTVRVAMSFEVQLPEVFARTGFKGDFVMAGQWFPKIGVLSGQPGSEAWHCEPFHLHSEFFADFGTYDVTLTVPDTHVVAATGVLVAVDDAGDGMRRHHYRAEDVHDFAWMADPYMQVIEGTATNELGKVAVRVYARPDQREFAERHLAAGIAAIEQFSDAYVPYPWSLMSIIDPPVDAASGAGGMEYPTLVTTAGDSAAMRPGLYMPEFVTIHEVGHNWFQGILASNEVDEAWLDEGVNEYADGVVMRNIYEPATSMIDWYGIYADFFRLRQAMGVPFAHIPSPIATRSYEFPDYGSYGAATYAKTAIALRTLENIAGEEQFRGAMKSYAQAWAFKHPSGHDLFASLESALGRDLSWFTGPAFDEVGSVELRVRSVKCRRHGPPRGVFGSGDDRHVVDDDGGDYPQRCEVLIVNVGIIPVPVDVLIVFEDGTSQKWRWQADAEPSVHWHKIVVEHSTAIAEVTIDPEDAIVLNDSPLHSSWRAEPDSSASRRAAARMQFWTQTMMQVTGL